MNGPLISLIVPVYNGEAGINQCLNSLTGQTYKNIEVIVVNDGSQDRTQELLDAYAKRDPRVRPIHIPNGGVSNARNCGLDQAAGEYVMFVDGDDVLVAETLQTMLNRFDRETTFVQCGIRKIRPDGEVLQTIGAAAAELNGSLEIMAAFFRKQILSSVCAKLYRSSYLKDLRLDPRYAVGEDDLFSYFVCKKAQKVRIIDNLFYCYIENPDSVMHRSLEEKHFQILEIVEEQLKEQSDPMLSRLCAACYVQRGMELLWKIFDMRAMYQRFKPLRKQVLRYKRIVLFTNEFSAKDKLVYLLLWLVPRVYYKMKMKQNAQ